MKVLTIISHTEHYQLADGTIVGWGPTINEINYLATNFDTIYHIGMLYVKDAPLSAMPYTASNIVFVPIPPMGGTTLKSKFQIICMMPRIIRLVSKYIDSSDYFQLRTPTGIGVYLIPYLSMFVKTKGWYKYAGNWIQNHPPIGYRWQRWLLKIQNRPVTINGNWIGQPKHCLTFENPCLTSEEIADGYAWSLKRELPSLWHFCYVGRLEDAKGVKRIIESFTELSVELKSLIGTVHLVGDGHERLLYEKMAKGSGVQFKFHGFLARGEVFKVYMQSDVFLMPTQASEGFPKVIAEAVNYGCIPLVSDVSSIGQYIEDRINGFIIKDGNLENTKDVLVDVLLHLDQEKYKTYIIAGRSLANAFTFSNYLNKLNTLILK